MSENQDLDDRIGHNIARLRGELSQQDLADFMRQRGFKWSQATVWSTEQGKRSLRLAEAKSMAEVLGVDVGDLLEIQNEEFELRQEINNYLESGQQLEDQARRTEWARGALSHAVQTAIRRLNDDDLGSLEVVRYNELIKRARLALEGDLIYFINRALTAKGERFPYMKRQDVEPGSSEDDFKGDPNTGRDG